MHTAKPKVKFVLSVDTEEEWDWSGDFPQDNCSVKNIELLPQFHSMCQALGIRPSYFVDYAVANNSGSAAILKQIHAQGDSEIAAHLHPWCNPPYFGVTSEKESHVVNLPIEQVEAKLAILTDKLNDVFNTAPNAFRTGRWGINGAVLKLLKKYNYTLDTSVYPFYKHRYFDCNGASLKPYWPDFDNPNKAGQQRDIYQVPVTVGYNRLDFSASNKWHDLLSKPSLRWFRPVGIAWHLGILRKLYMCPEMATSEQMQTLAEKVIAKDIGVIHMYMHSSSLLSDATGFMKKGENIETINTRVRELVSYLKRIADVEFCTISEAANLNQTDNSCEN